MDVLATHSHKDKSKGLTKQSDVGLRSYFGTIITSCNAKTGSTLSMPLLRHIIRQCTVHMLVRPIKHYSAGKCTAFMTHLTQLMMTMASIMISITETMTMTRTTTTTMTMTIMATAIIIIIVVVVVVVVVVVAATAATTTRTAMRMTMTTTRLTMSLKVLSINI